MSQEGSARDSSPAADSQHLRDEVESEGDREQLRGDSSEEEEAARDADARSEGSPQRGADSAGDDQGRRDDEQQQQGGGDDVMADAAEEAAAVEEEADGRDKREAAADGGEPAANGDHKRSSRSRSREEKRDRSRSRDRRRSSSRERRSSRDRRAGGSREDLDEMFGRYGRIVEIRVNRDRFTGRCKGYAFVAMSREEEVDECIRRIDRTSINGYRLTVERAKTDLK